MTTHLWAIKGPDGEIILAHKEEQMLWNLTDQSEWWDQARLIEEGYRIVRVEVREVGE